MDNGEFDYESEPTSRDPVRNDQVHDQRKTAHYFRNRRSMKKLLIGIGIAVIIFSFLLIAFSAGVSLVGSTLYIIWGPFVCGGLSLLWGMICVFAGFRKDSGALLIVSISALVNILLISILNMFSVSYAFTRDVACQSDNPEIDECDAREMSQRIALNTMLVLCGVAIMAGNIIVCIVGLRMYRSNTKRHEHDVVI